MSAIRQTGESQNWCFKETKHAKFSLKTNISYPLISTRTCALQGVRKKYLVFWSISLQVNCSFELQKKIFSKSCVWIPGQGTLNKFFLYFHQILQTGFQYPFFGGQKVKDRFNLRSSRPAVFCKKVILSSFAKFTGKRLWKSLWHRCFPVVFTKVLRTSFL